MSLILKDYQTKKIGTHLTENTLRLNFKDYKTLKKIGTHLTENTLRLSFKDYQILKK